MGTHAKVRGFALVELLVAMTILTLVIAVASYGYALFSRHWEGRLGRFDRAQAQYQRLDLVFAALENALPYVVRDAADRPGFYFLGREEGLTLVTASPVFTPGATAVVRLFREAASDGRWNLVYEEAPLTGVQLRRSAQELPFEHRLVVLSGVESPRFEFFGWPSLDERMESADAPERGLAPQWLAEYDGLLRRQHPQRIALELGGTRAIVFVPERAEVAMRQFMGTE